MVHLSHGCTTAPTSAAIMNDTAQETTAVMTLLVEHEVLGASLLSVEEENKIALLKH